MFRASHGQALIEVLLAVTLGALFLAAAAIAISSLLLVSAKNRDYQTALGLATELSSNVKTMADQNWQSVFGLTHGTSTKYYISTTSSVFSAISGTETTTLGGVTFSRYFSVTAVSRALCGAGAVTTTVVTQCASGPGAVGVAEDAASQNIYVYVSKVGANGAGDIALIKYSQLITRTRNKILRQADWSGGSGQEGPSPSGLIGYWPLDEGSGTSTADVSGYGNSGTLTGGPTWNSSGKVNSALDFNGSDEYITIGDINPITSVTITAWIYPTGTSPADRIIVSKDNTEYGFRIVEITGTLQGIGGGNAIVETGVDLTSAANRNKWHFVAYTLDTVADTHVLYRNGAQVNSGSNTGTIANAATALNIGRHPQFGGFGYFLGRVDDVRVYNRALSSSEVSALYAGTFPYLNSKFSTSANLNFASTTGSLTMINPTWGRASTSLISSVFDTGAASGLAYKINSILWQGTLANSAVWFQIATSNNASGTWNEALNYWGPDGTNATYYTAAPNIAIQIARAYGQDQRFFRYKIFFGDGPVQASPTVDDVIVNWGL